MDKHIDPLYKFVINSVDEADSLHGQNILLDKFQKGVESNELNDNDLKIVEDLINSINGIRDGDRGMIIVLIRSIIVIVERIPGKNIGNLKKRDALRIFSTIVNCIGISKKDINFYMSIFDNSVELAFWGRDWMKRGGWGKIKNLITCCN